MNNNLQFMLLKKLVMQFRMKLTDDELVQLFYSDKCSNIKQTLEYIIDKYNKNEDAINASDEYKKMIFLFRKTRIIDFPNLEFFKEIPMELAEKFKLKVYKLFYDSHLFSNPKALINMIGMFGLFENDDKVQKRINDIINIFFYQKIYCQRKEFKNKANIEEKKNTLYILDENVRKFIPEELKSYIYDEAIPNYYTFLRNMKGNFGRKINDFLIPYTNVNGEYKIKKGIEQNKEYFEYLKKQSVPYYAYEKDIDTYYGINYKLPLSLIKKMLSEFKEYELTYGPSDVQSMFLAADPIYDPKFYQFFIRHQSDIVNSTNCFSKFPFVQKKYYDALKFYQERGNDDPDYNTIIEWLRCVPYNVEFGDEEFAIEAKNAGVLKEGYDYYANLLKKVRTRYIRVLPNHNKQYTFIGSDNKVYHIETKILDGTDPFNMLIGESKYTDCCQKYDDLGRSCLEHASKSLMGGILTVNLIENGISKPLSQSWTWINEQEMVLDNVEQTILLKSAPTRQQQIYEDLIAYALRMAATDIIKNSNEELFKYIAKKILEINTIDDENIKKERLLRLREIAERQSIKLISIGSNYSDIIVKDYFDTLVNRPLFLPKDYDANGYSDAVVRYAAVGSEANITLEPNERYVEEPIYRVTRKIQNNSLLNINNELLKRIIDIDRSISNVDNDLLSLEKFIEKNGFSSDDMITIGEDWYCIYRNNGEQPEIVKISLGQPRLNDEKMEQEEEVKELITNLNINNNIEKGFSKKLKK